MKCPSCHKEVFLKKETYKEYILYKCNHCCVQFWTPLRHPGKEFYETSKLHRIEGTKKLQWRHKQFLKNPPVKKGLLLDVACGTGEFLNAAKKIGFDVWGIDLSSKQIESAKFFYNLKNVFDEDIDKFILRDNLPKFDVVTFFEVLEHLDNPHAFFKAFKEILSPNGIIVFSVPNTDRVWMGKEPEEVPPNHLFRWTSESIKNFLVLERFHIKKIIEQPFSGDFFFTTGLFSFGVVKDISKRDNNKNKIENVVYKINLKDVLIKKVANVKNKILIPVAFILAVPLRLFGFKYWDLYIVAKIK